MTNKEKAIQDGVAKAQQQMQAPLPKRFYTTVSVAPVEGGFAVLLDKHQVRTPARHVLVLPNEALANLVADEFRLQDKVINPAGMPVTRLVNTVIDGVAADPQPVLEDILRFAANDLLFYRASTPRELVARQSEQWDPVLDWAQLYIGARFVTGEGVMHIEQPRESVAAVSVHLRQYTSPFAVAAIHAMTTMTGSVLLALAVAAGEIDVATGWQLAHLDEDWTIEHWGADKEATMRRANRENEIYAAAAVLAMS